MTSTPTRQFPSNVVDQRWLCCYSTRHSSLNEQTGKWLLFGNRVNRDSLGLTDFDRLWRLVQDVTKTGKLCCAKCTTAVGSEDAENGVIMCFTHDYRNKKEVKEVAVAIRQHISYHKDIFYKLDTGLNSSISSNSCTVHNNSVYKYTTRNEFYERGVDGVSWKVVEDKSPNLSCIEVCSDDSDLEESYEEESDEEKFSIAPLPSNALPSKVRDRYWIWCYGIQKQSSSSRNVGKWMLFANRLREDSAGLTDFDRLWSLVKQIVQDGKLYGAKCSTSRGKNDSTTNGVIICYTFDYTNKTDVKNAADAIRDYINYPAEIYYKTDVATGQGLYVDNGNQAVSLYKHTRQNQFFERDTDGKSWKLVVLDG